MTVSSSASVCLRCGSWQLTQSLLYGLYRSKKSISIIVGTYIALS